MTKAAFSVDKRYNRVYYNPGIITPEGRLSWPSLDKPKDPPPPKPGESPGKPRFESTLLLDKTNPEVIKLKAELEQLSLQMVALFNQNSKTKIASTDVFKDGDLSDKEKYAHDAGKWLLVARTVNPPSLRDANNKPFEASLIKGGLLGRFVVVPHLGSSGFSYRLEIVQITKDDGTRFGGGRQDYSELLDAIGGEHQYETEEAALTPNAPGEDLVTHLDAPLTPKQLAEQQRANMSKAVQPPVQKGGKGKASAINLL